MPSKGYKQSESHRNNISKARIGMKFTEEHSRNIRLQLKGKYVDENSFAWKGDKVGYRALHRWVRKVLGVPQKCEHCGKERTAPKSIHWANKSGEYKRDTLDWISLCVPCHKKYDSEKG